MTDRPTRLIVDCSTGESQQVELTDEEMAQREADRIAYEAEQAAVAEQAAQKAAERQALLDRLGISEQEAQLLLGA
jgi:hypothetical protein